jgi:hypothetical protein
MHHVSLGFVLAAAIVAPASAQTVAASGFSSSSGFGNVRFVSPPPPGSVMLPGFAGRHHRHVRVADGVIAGGWGYGGYNDYGDYDANRSFSPDKWNDWWHERPERAFPRWMSRNQDCQRLWWSGGGWRC